MLSKKLGSVKKLAKRVKSFGSTTSEDPEAGSYQRCLLDNESSQTDTMKTPTGMFPVYVGEDRQKFFVPTSYLSHPLFKMVLEKAYDEFGFDQRNGLEVPCTVTAFQEVIGAIECCNGKFDFGGLVEEFL